MTTSASQQWQLSAFGAHNLRYVDAVLPPLAPHQVLVQVEAVSLNYRDLMLVENRYGMAPRVAVHSGLGYGGHRA
jgi:alcohol dehydrogenase